MDELLSLCCANNLLYQAGNRETQREGEYVPESKPAAGSPHESAQKHRRFMVYVHSKLMIVDDEVKPASHGQSHNSCSSGLSQPLLQISPAAQMSFEGPICTTPADVDHAKYMHCRSVSAGMPAVVHTSADCAKL